MSSLCCYFGISRTAYYKREKSVERELLEEGVVLDLVHSVRRDMPRLGGRKLYHLLYDDLQSLGKIGRDKFFALLSKNDLLVERKRSYTKTTNSFHHYRRWKNQLKSLELTHSNQAWGSDITYLRTVGGFVYLSLITDLHSRKIVGYSLSRSLSVEGSIEALKMALRGSKNRQQQVIHHSDRGIQYCCHAYVGLLQKNNILISMTEDNHCYENSKSERVNGILKDEFYLDSTFNNFEQAFSAVRSAVKTYNERRPHWALQLRTPHQVHIDEVA